MYEIPPILILPSLGRAEGLGAYLKATCLRFAEEPSCTDKSVIHLSVVIGAVNSQSFRFAVTAMLPSVPPAELAATAVASPFLKKYRFLVFAKAPFASEKPISFLPFVPETIISHSFISAESLA